MAINDRCAVGTCNNARKYPEKYVIKRHISAFNTSLSLHFWKFSDGKIYPKWTFAYNWKTFKGKRSFGKKIFFSSPRQGNMEWKSNLKKKIKIPLFLASQTTFWKCRKWAQWWRTECFWRNKRSKQLIEVLKCVYDVTNSETLRAHNFWLKHIQKVKYTLYC